MVVAGRLLWIIEKINMGHQVVISSSFNTNGDKQKLKVLIQPIAGAVIGPEINQGIALAAVMFLSHIANNELLARSVCLTDRGHKHSDGVSEVCFWMVVKKAVFDGSGLKEAEEKTVVLETDANADVARGSFPAHDCTFEEDLGNTCSAIDLANTGNRGSGAVVAFVGGEVLSGVGGGTVDPGPSHTVCNNEGGTGSICQSNVDKEDLVHQPKRARVLVEM